MRVGCSQDGEVTFERISQLVCQSNPIEEWQIHVSNGVLIRAKMVYTKRAGQVKTSYLHTMFQYPSGYWETYREQANGNHKMITNGRDFQGLKEFGNGHTEND